MALTTAAAFNEFHDRIILTSAQNEKVNARTARVREVLTAALPASCAAPIKRVSLIGSAARTTIIRPLDDIDVLAEFRNKDDIFEKYRHDSQAFLYWVRGRIDAKTEVMRVGARGQVVRLHYTDGLHVDIAPVFGWSGGGFALPAGDGTWLTTDPHKQATWAGERQKALGNHFKRRVRLLKRWNREHSRRLGSWHLEVLIGTVFGSMSDNNRKGVAKFFEFAQGSLHVNDPDGHGGDLASGFTMAQELAVEISFATNQERASNAVAAEANGDDKEAIRLWRIIFGEEFPVYG